MMVKRQRMLTRLPSSWRKLKPASTAAAATLPASPTSSVTVSKKGADGAWCPSFAAPAQATAQRHKVPCVRTVFRDMQRRAIAKRRRKMAHVSPAETADSNNPNKRTARNVP